MRTLTYQFECLKLKRLITLGVGKDMKALKLSCIAGVNENDTISLNKFGTFFKIQTYTYHKT